MKSAATFAAASCCVALASTSFAFWVRMEEGHCHPIIDFNPGTGGWETYVEHDTDGNWPPEITLLYVKEDAWPAGARIPRPPGTQWDFIGVPAHSNIWLLPHTEQPGLLWLGFANHSPFNTFAAYSESDPRVGNAPAKWISYHLRAVRFYGAGPGHVACWTTDGFGQPTVWFSTADGGLTADDRFLLTEGGHVHVNWSFSDPGWYELDLQASGYRHGSMAYTNSPVVTFTIGVGTTNAPRITALTPSNLLVNATGTNLLFQLETSADGFAWQPAGPPIWGSGSHLWLNHAATSSIQFLRYRVWAP